MKKLLALALIPLMLTGCGSRGNGDKIGVIVKMAQEGILCQTWEGEIVRGGMAGGTGVNGQSFHFTVEDQSLVKKLQDAMNDRKEVRIHYRRELATFCRSETDDNSFITDVTVIEQDTTSPFQPTTKITPVTTEVQSTPVTTDNDRQDKILKLVQMQSQLINELVQNQK